MNFINPLSYDEVKFKFPSLVQDIQNSLFRFNNKVVCKVNNHGLLYKQLLNHSIYQ